MFKKRYLLLFLLLAGLLAPLNACGSVLYTVVDNTYTSGSMGSVPVMPSGIPGTPLRNVVTNLGGDHKLYSFRNDANELRVMLTQYTRGQSDSLWIYDAQGDYRTPVKEARWLSFANSRGVVAMGRYLYAVDYDNACVTKVDTANDTYNVVDFFNYNGTAGYDVHGEGIVRVGNYVYALFNEKRGDWTALEYNSGKVVKLDGDLNVIAEVAVGRNALSIKVHNGMIYVVSSGGAQRGGRFNPDSMIQRVNPNNMNAETLLRAGGSPRVPLPEGWRYDFRDLSFALNGDVYIFAGVYNEDWTQFDSRIFKTTLPALVAGNVGQEYRDTSGPGFAWGIEYDNADNILWCAAGSRLTAYKGVNSWEFGASALGGNFYSFVVVDAPVNAAPGDSGGGGCNSSAFPAVFLLAILPILFIRAGKKFI